MSPGKLIRLLLFLIFLTWGGIRRISDSRGHYSQAGESPSIDFGVKIGAESPLTSGRIYIRYTGDAGILHSTEVRPRLRNRGFQLQLTFGELFRISSGIPKAIPGVITWYLSPHHQDSSERSGP